MMESLHLGSQGTHMHVHVAIGNSLCRYTTITCGTLYVCH